MTEIDAWNCFIFSSRSRSFRGPKNVLINAVRPDVGRSCLLNVGANNVASEYRREPQVTEGDHH